MSKLFGTDGIRGIANRELTPELALRIGRAGALILGKGCEHRRILIGRDPRISGEMLEGALTAGITSTGMDVISVGIVPTPVVAYLAKSLGCCGGIMISASHNPLQDNGIKFFGADGYKLSDSREEEIEKLIPADNHKRPIAGGLGRFFSKPEAAGLYLKNLKERASINLEGQKIALDCAHGATAAYAPRLFRELGAQVSVAYDRPNGLNINDGCGSTYPEKIQNFTKEMGADVGFAFDGDGDRVLAVDEQGNLLDGDHILAIIGLHLLRKNQLPGRKIVATAYSNGGLRQAFLKLQGDVVYAPIGDRYVVEVLRQKDLILGGEQSGHIIFLQDSTTGDGILTALKLLQIYLLQEKPFSQLAQSMEVFPQLLVNVPVPRQAGWEENERIKEALARAEEKMQPLGRIFIRASGTEPLIRILGEHPDQKIVQAAVDHLADIIRVEQGEAARAN